MVTDTMIMVMEGFQNRISGQVSGMMARRSNVKKWEWALVDAALEVTGIWTIREYMRRRQAKIAEYVAGRLIYDMYKGVESMEGPRRFLRWWYQSHGPTQDDREVGRKINIVYCKIIK